MNNTTKSVWAAFAALVCFVSCANVVYDAGSALKENIRSGVKANPYTDVNGGQWGYLWRENVTDTGAYSGTYRTDSVFPGVGSDLAPWIRVNASGVAQGAGLDKPDTSVNIYDVVPGLSETDPLVEQMIEPGELVFHPRAYKDEYNKRLYAAIRFTVPEDGWYELDCAARDLMRQVALCTTNEDGSVKEQLIGNYSGAQVTILTNKVQMYQQIVSLEDYETNTYYTANGCVKSFTYRPPAMKLKKNDTIELVVANKDDSGEEIDIQRITNYSDSTGVKMTVTKLDRLVYDGGKALRQNITGTSPVGKDGAVYTDELGGQWKYLKASRNSFSTTTNFTAIYTSSDNPNYWGIGTGTAPWIRVNKSGVAQSRDAGEILEPDELYIHPGNPYNGEYTYSMLRFVVPESGYYSAFMSAHDVSEQTETPVTVNSGADVALLVNGVVQASGVVSVDPLTTEIQTNSTPFTRRFDFQMPVRYMEAGEMIDFAVGPNGTVSSCHTSDGTGMKAYVTREKEGTFYDAGLEMKNNVAAGWSRKNPYGTVADGTWYYLNCAVPYFSSPGTTYGMDDEHWASWSPTGLISSASLLVKANRTTFGVGFASNDTGTSPFLYGSTNTVNRSGVAPGEVFMHPNIAKGNADLRSTWTNKCATLRFRPTESGWYSGSIVVRDVAKSGSSGGTMWGNGVRVYLNVGNVAVTNANIALEAFTASTAHFTIEPQLLVAGEPVDIVVYPNDQNDSDGTAVSAIFRREQSAYDAGLSFFRNNAPGEAGTKPFADALGSVMWDVGYCTYTTNPASFKALTNQFSYVSSPLGWRGYSFNSSGNLPRVMIATNGIASTDGNYVSDTNTCGKLFGTIPCEMWAHPNNYPATRSVVVRATVPVDGIYSARGYGRDLKASDTAGADGVRLSLGVDGSVPSTTRISRGDVGVNINVYEASVGAERLWLRQGSFLDFVVEMVGNYSGDGTGLSACLVNDGNTPGAELSVVNVAFTDTTGMSPFDKPGREGWSDWTTWNALNISGSPASVERGACTEAAGSKVRNMKVSVSRSSGNIVMGTATEGNLLMNRYVKSASTSEVYTFTISRLKANTQYTLYLYSAYGNSDGKAVFAVGGVTKSPDGSWFDGYGVKDVARFDVTSDSTGRITGTFRLADGVSAGQGGGAFNGLTIVGSLPEYKRGMMTLFK